MDGRQGKKIDNERPIAKPSFPLPVIFDRGHRSEAPTRRRERAYFYRKENSRSSSPAYGFFITAEPAEKETYN